MGNCQASDAACVLLELPAGKTQKMYWQASAREIMVANPGHYVAHVFFSATAAAASATTQEEESQSQIQGQRLLRKHVKLLRPDDLLKIGNTYRLVSFEDVLKEFSGKDCSKLNRLIAMQTQKKQTKPSRTKPSPPEMLSLHSAETTKMPVIKQPPTMLLFGGNNAKALVRRQHQWRPALQSISETGHESFYT